MHRRAGPQRLLAHAHAPAADDDHRAATVAWKLVRPLLFVYIAYLVLANVALVARWRVPGAVSYRAAWTLLPGVVQARGVALRSAPWSAELDGATARLHVLDLLRGRGAAATLDGELRELSGGSLRFVGDADLTAPVGWRSGRMAATAPLSLRVRTGDLHVGARRVADELHGVVELDPGELGEQRELSPGGRVVLEARLVDPSGLFAAALGGDPELAGAPALERACPRGSGAGELRADVRVERGVVQPESAITVIAPGSGVELFGLCAALDATGRWAVEPGPAGLEATLRVQVSRASVGRLDAPAEVAPATLLEDATITLRMERESPALATPPGVVSGEIEIPALEIPDLRWLDADLTGGPGVARIRLLRAAGEGWSGAADATLKSAAYALGGAILQGDLVVEAELQDLDFAARSARIPAGTIEGTGLTLSHDGASFGGQQGRLTLEGGALTADPPGSFEGDVTLAWSDVGSIARIFEREGLVPGWAAGVLTGPFSAQAHVARRGSSLVLDLERAQAGLEARGRLRRDPSGMDGAFLISRGFLSAGIHIEGGDARITPLVGGAWLEQHIAALDEGALAHDAP